MKYYLTSRELKRSVVGYPWQTGMIPEYYKGSNYFTTIKKRQFPDFEPVVKLWLDEIRGKSKFTDIMDASNFSANGFLVSPRVKELWKNFNIFSSRYYPGTVTVKSTGEEREYYLFHMAAEEVYGIDFQKSLFNDREQIIGEDEEGWPIFEETKLNKLSDRYGHDYGLRKLFFTADFPKFDLFYIPYFMFMDNFFISEGLKNAMVKEKITGLKYEEQTFIDEW